MEDPLRICLERIVELHRLQADIKHIDEAIEIAEQVLEGYSPHVVLVKRPEDEIRIFGLFRNLDEAIQFAKARPKLKGKVIAYIDEPY